MKLLWRGVHVPLRAPASASQAPQQQGRVACHRVVHVRRRASRVWAGAGGDEELQRQLEAELTMETNKAKGKAKLDQYVEEEVFERLNAITEEGKAQLDEVLKANEDRSALEFGAALADIEKQTDVDAIIAAARATAEEELRKVFLLEQEVESNLNSALPFKNLYSSKVPLSSAEQQLVGKEELDALDAVTREQLGKQWRTLSYGAIALALFGLSVAALAKDSTASKAMFVVFLLVFTALAAQVFVEQDSLLASRPFDDDDDA